MSSRIPWLWLTLCLCALPAFAEAVDPSDDDTDEDAAPPAAEAPGEDPCLRATDADEVPAIAIALHGKPQRIDKVQLTGLTTLREEQVWNIVTRTRPASLSVEQAQRLVARLQETGLFSEVKPTVRVDAEAVLEISLTEFPTVQRVGFRGLTELRPEELTEDLFRSPDDSEWEGGDHCRPPTPPSSLVARLEHKAFYAGIAWRGLSPGLDRVLHRIREKGYVLASLEATLSQQGELVIDVDEGHLEKITLEGVPPELEPKVRKELALEPGKVFVADELERAVERVRERFPFLTAEVRPPETLAGEVHVEGEGSAEHGWKYSTVPGRGDEGGKVSMDIHVGHRGGRITFDPHAWGERHHKWAWHGWHPDRGEAKIHGKDVEVDFDSARTELKNEWAELFRHTQVTGFAPGLMLSGWLWDPNDRFHVGVDAGINFNTGRPDRVIDWTIGPRLQVPLLHLAELGVQFHSNIDTEDRWRVSRIDSYLHSLLFRRPESEYFHRTGLWAFATWQPIEKLLVGAEYRRDTYDSLAPLPSVWTLTHQADGTYPNPAITDGQMGSMVLRLEYSTSRARLHEVGNPWRALGRSLIDRAFYGDLHTGLTTIDTVEISTAGLGSAANLSFIKFISDTSLHFATGHWSGLRLRVRAAGGPGLPLQKQEALGGWGSLRGFGFKEFRGDYSVLGSAEYQLGFVSAFADVGSVKEAGGWVVPKLGLGAQLNFGDWISFAVAWRTDERASLLPEARLTLGRSF